jgi:hypothetical protein
MRSRPIHGCSVHNSDYNHAIVYHPSQASQKIRMQFDEESGMIRLIGTIPSGWMP